jgi:hypothetical protein
MSPAAGTSQNSARRTKLRSAQSPQSVFGGIVLIIVLALIVYWPSLRGGFLLDDEDLLQRCGSAGLLKIWASTVLPDYWPMTQSMLCIEYRAWGNSTLGYHLINLLLHLGATFLLWRLLRMLAIPGAFIAALLFAVHPVNVESVAWIAQRKNTLAMVFFLLSAYLFLRSEEQPSKKFPYAMSLGCFVLAMLSKISVAILPPVLLLLVWWRRGLTKRDVIRVAAFFAVAALLAMVNIWFMAHANTEGIRAASWMQRLLGAGAVIWFYLYKAVAPFDLAFIYPKWQIDPAKWMWSVPLIASVVVTAILFWKKRGGVGRALFVAWMFFCVALLPVMGLSDTGFMKFSLVADHYQHIAIIAVVALVGAGLSQIGNYKLQTGVGAVVAVGLTILAMQQAALYRDSITLYRAAVAKNPTSWILHGNLADDLLAAGKVNEAIPEFRETLRLNPQSDDAHYFFAKALEKTGDMGAIEHLKTVLSLPVNQYQMDAAHELALIYLTLGRKAEASEMEQKAQNIARENGLVRIVEQSEMWMKQNGLK